MLCTPTAKPEERTRESNAVLTCLGHASGFAFVACELVMPPHPALTVLHSLGESAQFLVQGATKLPDGEAVRKVQHSLYLSCTRILVYLKLTYWVLTEDRRILLAVNESINGLHDTVSFPVHCRIGSCAWHLVCPFSLSLFAIFQVKWFSQELPSDSEQALMFVLTNNHDADADRKPFTQWVAIQCKKRYYIFRTRSGTP